MSFLNMDDSAQIALLTGLLEQYSPTLQESAAVAYLSGQMQPLGFSVRVDSAGSVIGSLGSGTREIILLGHIDTVPGDIPVHQDGDLLFGRGAVDAKGPLACFVLAAYLAGAPEGWKLTVIGATGEEGDSRGAKLVRDAYSAGKPELVIIGEPSRWDHLTLGYKGSAWMEYEVRRTLAHTAGRSESACDTAIQFWNRVQAQKERYNAGQQRAFDQLTTSLRGMQSTQDGFYETARLRFNLRLPPGLSVDDVTRLLLREAGDGELQLLDGIECYRTDKNTPLVRAFLTAIRNAGGQPGFYLKTGTSDMNIVGPAWSVPILAYGPGDSSLDHTPDEHISVEEFLKSVRVLKETLALLTRPSSHP